MVKEVESEPEQSPEIKAAQEFIEALVEAVRKPEGSSVPQSAYPDGQENNKQVGT